ncbi:hypothetical protein CHLRE_17g714200v5 [Chlamydomonas reinhardtii]|uniref:Potassium transporter n=1 Tax=Chlamydomonas reinhardtii TaxID=3055 RepID=A0A2K3CPT7_CHLRE|nr:uncharacterized protein CHLRE_17g714200v5 [Chlamydomonas reinhardtii]PNW70302.1 hypothetical protein CHLRE_17g714200v5 [Chlamydomonas reinhardtii]
MKLAASAPEERDEEGLGGITFTKKKETIAVTAALAWGSLGCIYGDIGTSPLYVYSTIFSSSEPSQADILGAISLIFWTLTLIVLVKYVGVVLLADDEGEGGTFSLYSLLCRKIGIRPHDVMFRGESRMMRHLGSSSTGGSQLRRTSGSGTRGAGLRPSGDGTLRRLSTTPQDAAAARSPDTTLTLATSASRVAATAAPHPHPQQPRRVWWRRWAASGTAVRATLRRNRAAQMGLWVTTMAATGMVLGDGVLTPAVSVMSAVSGLKEATDAVTQQTVVGVSIAVLVLLFSVQRCGTSKVSSTFAPIVALWLCANAGVAAYNLALHGGGALAGLSPHHIPLFFARRGVEAWRMLGSVMLCVTGAEALYADLGHFTHRSVLASFCLFVYPCLVLTYVGQGAYLMSRPEDVSDTFWKCVPRPFFYPMLVLATLASVVASQALITGCFSIISNAIKLGAFPKLSVLHTSEHVRGQVYVAEINWILMLLCIGVVAGFQDTVALGLAYGLAVSSVFVLTTLLILVVMVAVWEVSLALVAPFALVFLAIELAFLSSNLAKVPEGAWFSLAVSAGGIYVMTIWWVGSTRRALLLAASAGRNRLSELFVMMPLQPQQSHMAAPAAQVPQPQQVRREAPRAIAESLEDGHQQEAEQQEMQGAAHSPAGADAAAACTTTAATPQPAAAPGASSGGGLLHPEREIVTASNTPSSGTHGSATPADGGAIGHLPSRRRTAATATSAFAAAAGISGRGDGNAAVPTSHPHKSDSLSRGSPAQLLAAVSARLSMWRPVQLALRLPPQPLLGADGSAAVGSQGLGLGADGAGAEQQQQQQLWPLSRQPGIGLYYSETPVGLPHVLIHFLRNVQSVHDVSVFLTVRVVPLPHVQPVERLLVRQLAPFPNFYQVVARYGYMDRVDHGAAFIRQVVSGIVRVLRGGPAVAADVSTVVAATGGGTGADTAAAAAAAAGDGIAGSGSGSSGGGAGGFRFVTRNRRSNGHRGSRLSAAASRRGVGGVSAPAGEEQERQGGQAGQQPEQPQGGWSLYGMGLSRQGGMVLQPGEVDFISSSSSSSDRGYNSAVEEDSDTEDEDEVEAVPGVSAAVAHSSNVSGGGVGTAGGNTGGTGGVELSEVVVVAAHTAQVRADHAPAPQPPAALPSPSTGAPPPVSLPAAPAALQASRSRPRLARAALGVTSQLPSGGRVVVDEAAVAHVLEAARHGVVYYLGAVRVRPEPGSPLLAQLLFGATYRLLLGLSRSEVEDWRLPYEHVVELGMVLRIG